MKTRNFPTCCAKNVKIEFTREIYDPRSPPFSAFTISFSHDLAIATEIKCGFGNFLWKKSLAHFFSFTTSRLISLSRECLLERRQVFNEIVFVRRIWVNDSCVVGDPFLRCSFVAVVVANISGPDEITALVAVFNCFSVWTSALKWNMRMTCWRSAVWKRSLTGCN